MTSCFVFATLNLGRKKSIGTEPMHTPDMRPPFIQSDKHTPHVGPLMARKLKTSLQAEDVFRHLGAHAGVDLVHKRP